MGNSTDRKSGVTGSWVIGFSTGVGGDRRIGVDVVPKARDVGFVQLVTGLVRHVFFSFSLIRIMAEFGYDGFRCSVRQRTLHRKSSILGTALT